MFLRELEQKSAFSIFTANIKVRQQFYSQWIPVQVSARNIEEAKRIILGQYGAGTAITGLRKSK